MDNEYMFEALKEAEAAFAKGEVPIGAVIVRGGEIIARAHNLRESLHDPTAHAEMIAIRMAGSRLGDWRITGSTLYVTVEPCPMCAGALVMARIERLVYGVRDPKAGAAGSLMNIVQDVRLNHRLEVVEGVLAEECGRIIQRFFQGLRGVVE